MTPRQAAARTSGVAAWRMLLRYGNGYALMLSAAVLSSDADIAATHPCATSFVPVAKTATITSSSGNANSALNRDHFTVRRVAFDISFLLTRRSRDQARVPQCLTPYREVSASTAR